MKSACVWRRHKLTKPDPQEVTSLPFNIIIRYSYVQFDLSLN